MIYVISDLHGYPLEKLKALLKKANFNENDFLYILGDVIDRNGDGGVAILQWLLCQTNAELFLGNHESMLLSCSFLFDEITDDSIEKLDSVKMSIFSEYMLNGGTVTLKAMRALMQKSPEIVKDIIDYLCGCPVYDTVEVGNKEYFLSHSGIDGFVKGKRLSDYPEDAFYWGRPNLTDEYFNTATCVFGHTPTSEYGEEYRGKIIKTKTWINIDMGASDGVTEPVLLRLDDMAEFRN